MLEVPDVFAIGSEDLDVAKAVAADGIVSRSVLLGLGDEKDAADVLYVEGREAFRDALIVAVKLAVRVAIAIGIERIIIEVYAFKIGVVDFHSAGTEIRDVEEFVAVDLAGRCAFVYGAVGGPVVGIIHFEYRVQPSGSAEDGSILCREDEVRRFARF